MLTPTKEMSVMSRVPRCEFRFEGSQCQRAFNHPDRAHNVEGMECPVCGAEECDRQDMEHEGWNALCRCGDMWLDHSRDPGGKEGSCLGPSLDDESCDCTGFVAAPAPQ